MLGHGHVVSVLHQDVVNRLPATAVHPCAMDENDVLDFLARESGRADAGKQRDGKEQGLAE
ncbi:hypothetical protein D3C71_2236130 [compost metagenome]